MGPQGPPGLGAAFAFVGDDPLDISTLRNIGALTLLPAGKYVVSAKARFDLPSDLVSRLVQCTLEVGAESDRSAVLLQTPGTDTIPLSVAAELPAGGGAILSCQGSAVLASRVRLTAILVDELTFEP